MHSDIQQSHSLKLSFAADAAKIESSEAAKFECNSVKVSLAAKLINLIIQLSAAEPGDATNFESVTEVEPRGEAAKFIKCNSLKISIAAKPQNLRVQLSKAAPRGDAANIENKLSEAEAERRGEAAKFASATL